MRFRQDGRLPATYESCSRMLGTGTLAQRGSADAASVLSKNQRELRARRDK